MPFDHASDRTPILVGAGQHIEPVEGSDPPFSSPMDLAARAANVALADAGCPAEAVEALAVVRLFSDATTAWASPFGGSDNPPASVAQRLGCNPARRIYSNIGGNQPLALAAEFAQAIARGELDVGLVTGAEAIATQREAGRREISLDWTENFDAPFEDRPYLDRVVAKEEIEAGLVRPVNFYALIENRQAHLLGHTPAQHRDHMGALLAGLNKVAAGNPMAWFRQPKSAEDIVGDSPGNYAMSEPYRRYMIAQDAVNQSAAVVVMSIGKARELGIDPSRWIYMHGYAQGEEPVLMVRPEIARSPAMEFTLETCLRQSGRSVDDMDLIDIYSCFACAVQAVCTALDLPSDGARPLTLTGGLPFFGGPGNNYSMHALAAGIHQLRGTSMHGLITANGGQLTKHAAMVLSNAAPTEGHGPDWSESLPDLDQDSLASHPTCATPDTGEIVSYTVRHRRGKSDIGIVLAQNTAGERFIASTADASITGEFLADNPIGRQIQVTGDGPRWGFELR